MLSLAAPLRTYPVSLDLLERKTAGRITGETLGVTGGEMDVNLNDFKDATIGVTLGASILGIASLAFLPENVGAAFCYFFALVPILWLAVGSTVPALIAGLIKSTRGDGDDGSYR